MLPKDGKTRLCNCASSRPDNLEKLCRCLYKAACAGTIVGSKNLSGVSNLWPAGCTGPRKAMRAAQHKIVNLPKTFFFSSVFVSVCVFNVWPGITLLLPVWPRDAKGLDTPGSWAVKQPAACWREFTSSWMRWC